MLVCQHTKHGKISHLLNISTLALCGSILMLSFIIKALVPMYSLHRAASKNEHLVFQFNAGGSTSLKLQTRKSPSKKSDCQRKLQHSNICGHVSQFKVKQHLSHTLFNLRDKNIINQFKLYYHFFFWFQWKPNCAISTWHFCEILVQIRWPTFINWHMVHDATITSCSHNILWSWFLSTSLNTLSERSVEQKQSMFMSLWQYKTIKEKYGCVRVTQCYMDINCRVRRLVFIFSFFFSSA